MNQRGEQGQSTMNEFADYADQRRRSFITELFSFLWENKAWWLAPIIIALLIVGGLILLGGTAAAPFIYTLF
jgi:hypothetical protein